MGRLSGKVAIITGAGGGQGAAEASAFAREGAKVVATDIQYDNVKQVVEEINAEFADSAIALEHDVSSKDQWEKVAKEAVSKFGKVNVLVHNAGILAIKPLDEITKEFWNTGMNINAYSQFVGTQVLVPYLKEAGEGSIINISSLASIVGMGAFSPYTASKGAVEALTRAGAVEFGPFNIRMNSVHPGIIDTQMSKGAFPTEKERKAMSSTIPIRRFGTPVDVANLVLFLASDESAYITGETHIIDGGYSAQ